MAKQEATAARVAAHTEYARVEDERGDYYSQDWALMMVQSCLVSGYPDAVAD